MGVMLFNGTMCIGRLLGNTIGKHLTSKQVVVGGYLLGAIAMGLIVFLPGYGSMYTYLLLGISLAMVVPNFILCYGGTKCYSYDTGCGNIYHAWLYGDFDGTCIDWIHCSWHKSYRGIYRIDYIACC